jgi:hypothetical protein
MNIAQVVYLKEKRKQKLYSLRIGSGPSSSRIFPKPVNLKLP